MVCRANICFGWSNSLLQVDWLLRYHRGPLTTKSCRTPGYWISCHLRWCPSFARDLFDCQNWLSWSTHDRSRSLPRKTALFQRSLRFPSLRVRWNSEQYCSRGSKVAHRATNPLQYRPCHSICSKQHNYRSGLNSEPSIKGAQKSWSLYYLV